MHDKSIFAVNSEKKKTFQENQCQRVEKIGKIWLHPSNEMLQIKTTVFLFPHKAQLHLIPSDFTADECKEHLPGHSIQSTTAPKYLADISCSVVVVALVKSVPLF